MLNIIRANDFVGVRVSQKSVTESRIHGCGSGSGQGNAKAQRVQPTVALAQTLVFNWRIAGHFQPHVITAMFSHMPVYLTCADNTGAVLHGG